MTTIRYGRLQYRLSSLLLLVALFAVILGGFVVPIHKRVTAVAQVCSSGGHVYFSCDVEKTPEGTHQLRHVDREWHELVVVCWLYDVSYIELFWDRTDIETRSCLTQFSEVACVIAHDEDLSRKELEEIRRLFPNAGVEHTPLFSTGEDEKSGKTEIGGQHTGVVVQGDLRTGMTGN